MSSKAPPPHTKSARAKAALNTLLTNAIKAQKAAKSASSTSSNTSSSTTTTMSQQQSTTTTAPTFDPELFETNPNYADITPIPQDDGPRPLSQIAYTPQYISATSYLRSLIDLQELSHRTLEVTAAVIRLNPAHYTAWQVRAAALIAMEAHTPGIIAQELNGFSYEMGKMYEKNYQIWRCREVLVDHLGELPEGELNFTEEMLAMDSKNYHVWSYRQWVVRRFNLWAYNDDGTENPFSMEKAYTDELIGEDVRNNSAWNHRFYVIFGRPDPLEKQNEGLKKNGELILKEIEYTKEKILLAPQNPSTWTYLKGLLSLYTALSNPCIATASKPSPYDPKSPLTEPITKFAHQFVPDDTDDDAMYVSSHAVEFLAESYALSGDKKKADVYFKVLAEKLDPVREGYWGWRRQTLGMREGV
ncbi:protein prenylyltransferase, partial [Ascobolus immersus RN42]